MKLFGKKDKRESNELTNVQKNGEALQECSIKVLGSGCKSCHTLYENTKKAVSDLDASIQPEYITDMQEVMKYGAMQMPALVINEKLVSSGKILKPADIEKLLNEHKQ